MDTSSKPCNIHPQNIHPQQDIALQHSLQAYIQIAYWETSYTESDPLLWTWKKQNKSFEKKLTHKVGDFPHTIAWVDNNLSRVHCKCKNLSRNQCGTNMCSCTENGPQCITACIECSGIRSYNTSEDDREVVEDIDIRILFEILFSWLI